MQDTQSHSWVLPEIKTKDARSKSPGRQLR